ncbi:MAG: sensor histidine kinase [Caulobacteraceae bacterium]
MHTDGKPLPGSTMPDPGSNAESIAFDSSAPLAESDHRIANHLALLLSYVRLKAADMDVQSEIPSRKSVQALLDGVSAQIVAVAKLHRALVSDAPSRSVDFGMRLREVCAPFVSGLSGRARLVEEVAPGCMVGAQQALPLSQIAAEVITNALKHAYDGANPTAVFVRCHTDAADDLQLEVIDSGGGFPADFDPQTDGGFGFRLVRGLGQKLGARISFVSTTGGVHFSLTLPAADRG